MVSKLIKNRLANMIAFIGTVLAIISALGVGGLEYYQTRQEKILLSKELTLLKKQVANDSLISSSDSSFARVITEYTSGCTLKVDGKEVTLSELVQTIVNLQIENQNLKTIKFNDSIKLEIFNQSEKTKDLKSQLSFLDKIIKDLNRYKGQKDTLEVYKQMFELAKRHYGFDVRMEKEGNKYSISQVFSRADSAKLLLQAYQNRLQKDESTGKWIIK